EIPAVAKDLNRRGPLDAERVAEEEVGERVPGVPGAERILCVAPVEVECALRGIPVQERVRLVRELNAELHIVITARPTNRTSILIRPDAIRFRAIIGAACERRITGKVQ